MTPLSAAELDDLGQAVGERLEDGLLPALAMASRTGELGELLCLLGMSDLLGDDGRAEVRPTKILVIGGSTTSEGKLRSIARRRGIASDDLECALGYDEVKHFSFATPTSTAPFSWGRFRTACQARGTPRAPSRRWRRIPRRTHMSSGSRTPTG